MLKSITYVFIFLFTANLCLGQEQSKDSLSLGDSALSTDSYSQIQIADFDPLSPSKAAFYSAIIPGLGQAYNKKYWKVPIVWGALGTSTYFYVTNAKEYDRYRTAYKQRKLGFQDEFYIGGPQGLSTETLEYAQESLQRNRDLSLLITIGLYALQILEASVNAHLMQFNMDTNISLEPSFDFDPISGQAIAGMRFTYKLNK